MKCCVIGGLCLAVRSFNSRARMAQGGGASSTGVIQGRVTDAQGAVLPGVTIVGDQRAMIGQQTVVKENGNYRFPAVPPGAYVLSFELAGLQHGAREGIQITLGFTAQRQRRAGAGDAAGNRDRHRRLADHRHDRDAHGAELQGGAAAVDPERPRLCGRCWR